MTIKYEKSMVLCNYSGVYFFNSGKLSKYLADLDSHLHPHFLLVCSPNENLILENTSVLKDSMESYYGISKANTSRSDYEKFLQLIESFCKQRVKIVTWYADSGEVLVSDVVKTLNIKGEGK